MPDSDIDDLVENDKQKFRRNYQNGFSRPSIPKTLESVCWALAICSIIFMVVTLPFAGPNNLISGTAWIGFSITGLGLFGSAALIIRLAIPDEL